MKGICAARRAGSFFVPVLLASTALTAVPVPAFAQQATEGGLEIVTVTAQKRTENLQTVPVSVQVLGEERLSQLHLLNVEDYVKLLPSVAIQDDGPGFVVVHMRGVASGENNNHTGPLPTVGTYLDEQPITTIGGTLDIHMFDIARVEALAGPQGTLYGASSEAGTLRIITNKPDPSAFSANYEIEGNSVDHGGLGYLVHGMVNVPLSDSVAVRVVAWDERDAGYIDNVRGTLTYPEDPSDPNDDITINNSRFAKNNYNTTDILGARAALQVNLNDDWTITPMVMAQTEDTHGVFFFDPHVGDLEIEHFLPEWSHDKWYQAALTIQGKISNLDIVYSGGHMDRRITEASDYSDYSYWYDVVYGYGHYWYDNSGNLTDPSQAILGKDHFTKDSHEIRLSSPTDQRLRWVAGLFYEQQTHRIEQRYVIRNLNDTIEVPGWPDTVWLTLQDRTDTDMAAFGEVSFDITPDLTLTGGIRGYRAKTHIVGFFGYGSGYEALNGSSSGVDGCFTGPVVSGTPCTDLDNSVSSSGETHKVNLTWRIDDDHMVYATYSTGFRPGGINRRADFPPFAPDTLTNYEIGWKTSWFDNRLRWNGAVFREQWKDFQFGFLGPNGLTIVANAGQAEVLGIETDINWLVTDNLILTAAAAFQDAELAEDYCGAPGPCPGTALAPKGRQLPVTPRSKVNLTARYMFDVGNWKAHLQGTVAYQSSVLSNLEDVDNQNAGGRQPAFTTADFTAGVDIDNWSFEAFAINAFDERAQLNRFINCNACAAQPYVTPNRPRTIGLRIGQKF